MHSAADDKRKPYKDAEDEDARCRIAALDLLGKPVFAVPGIDDEKAAYEADNPDRCVERARQHALEKIGRHGVIGRGDDDGAQNLADADERACRQPCHRAVAAADLLGEVAGDEEIDRHVGRDHEQDAECGIEYGEHQIGQMDHTVLLSLK